MNRTGPVAISYRNQIDVYTLHNVIENRHTYMCSCTCCFRSLVMLSMELKYINIMHVLVDSHVTNGPVYSLNSNVFACRMDFKWMKQKIMAFCDIVHCS